ncbi:NUDIX domain-containing protein [Haloglycomyces albus]|uniref:NUDIX domain-containing protein n=1 Tax=Haloglycomyces albus TaxID=526067 RepID=UPI00046D2094|nr:NUDIX hydrolase [Haloglycomyces albus]
MDNSEQSLYSITRSTTEYRAFAFDLKAVEAVMPDGSTVTREYVDHIGAVVVVPVNDRGQVAMLRQYRVPIGEYLWEVPAGIRDVAQEDPMATAQRELAEEADLRADDWQSLGSFYTSPGMSSECVHYFLARDLSAVAEDDRHVRTEEEAEMELHWWDLDKAVSAVSTGEIRNGICALALCLTQTALKSSK